MFDANTICEPSGDHAGLMLLPCSEVTADAPQNHRAA